MNIVPKTGQLMDLWITFSLLSPFSGKLKNKNTYAANVLNMGETQIFPKNNMYGLAGPKNASNLLGPFGSV